jgi:hypothetical protein
MSLSVSESASEPLNHRCKSPDFVPKEALSAPPSKTLWLSQRSWVRPMCTSLPKKSAAFKLNEILICCYKTML